MRCHLPRACNERRRGCRRFAPPTFAAAKLLTHARRALRACRFTCVPGEAAGSRKHITIEFQGIHHDRQGMSQKSKVSIIILQGETGMRFHLQTKSNGRIGTQVPSTHYGRPARNVCGDCLVEAQLADSRDYQRQSAVVPPPDEVQAGWRLVDPLKSIWMIPKHLSHCTRQVPKAQRSR